MVKYCIQCGTEIREGQMFCANCGAKAPENIGKFFKRKISKTAGWLDELE